jgi:chemotaxis protein CheZ
MSTTPALLSEEDYGAIEAAVMETERGRWFLAEYARRNRHADTTMLLTALDRIEAALRGHHGVEPVDRIRFDLVEMAKAIARTKAEIAAIKPDADHHGKFGEATEELDSIVQATESATSNILASAEDVQEIAWTLREQGMEAEVCDIIDGKATDIYTACSFQDLTGQRTRKVIQVLRYLESRINAMIKIWGLEGAMAAEAAETENVRQGEAALLNGPALPGQGLDQADIDMVMAPAEQLAAAPPEVPAGHRPTREEPVAAHEPEPEPMAPPLQPAADTGSVVEPALMPARSSERAAPSPTVQGPTVQGPTVQGPTVQGPTVQGPAAPPSDPLAAITALSYEEKIALFS